MSDKPRHYFMITVTFEPDPLLVNTVAYKAVVNFIISCNERALIVENYVNSQMYN